MVNISVYPPLSLLPLSFAHASFRMRAVSPFSIAARRKKQGKEKEKKKFCIGKERESEVRGVTK